MTAERAELIVRLRAERGGFVSADELCVFAELPPELTAQITDRTVYLPDGGPTALRHRLAAGRGGGSVAEGVSGRRTPSSRSVPASLVGRPPRPDVAAATAATPHR